MNRNDILTEAHTIINGARQESYGDAIKNFQLIAALWSSYLNATITPKQVADMMILLKIARNQNQTKNDNYIDICGYAALGAEVSDNSSNDKIVVKEAKRINKNLDNNNKLHEFFDSIMDKMKDDEIGWYYNEFDKKTYYVTSKNVFKILEDGISMEIVLEKSNIPKSELCNKIISNAVPRITSFGFGLRVNKNDSLLETIRESRICDPDKWWINYLRNNNLDGLIYRENYDWDKDDKNYDKFYLIHNKELYYFNTLGFPDEAHYDMYQHRLTCKDINVVVNEICNYLNSLDDESYKYFLRDSKKVKEN